MVDDEFYSSRQPHLTLETDCGFGYFDEEGRVTIHPSICVYRHQLMIARGIGMAPSKIRIIMNPMGATFGYKVAPTNEYMIAICVIATGRPVYMRLDMKEHITRTPKRWSPFLMKIRLGADEKGMLVGGEHHWYVDHGPYSESSQDLTNKGSQFFMAPYHLDNVRGCGYTIFTNHRWSAAFRAYGLPDLLGWRDGHGHAGPRVRHGSLRVPGPERDPSGRFLRPRAEARGLSLPGADREGSPALRGGQEAAAAGSTEEIKKGVGISFGIYNSNDDGADDASSNVELTKDGVILYNTWEDHGQGADAGCVGTAHEALKPLGLRPEQIRLECNDTAKALNSGAAAASRCQVMVGNAIVDSCNKLLEAMKKPSTAPTAPTTRWWRRGSPRSTRGTGRPRPVTTAERSSPAPVWMTPPGKATSSPTTCSGSSWRKCP